MTQFTDLVEAKLTGKQVALPSKLRIEESHMGVDHIMPSLYEYTINISFGFKAISSPSDLQHFKRLCADSFKEHIYREFREKMIDLDIAIWEQDMDAARRLIREIREEIR